MHVHTDTQNMIGSAIIFQSKKGYLQLSAKAVTIQPAWWTESCIPKPEGAAAIFALQQAAALRPSQHLAVALNYIYCLQAGLHQAQNPYSNLAE